MESVYWVSVHHFNQTLIRLVSTLNSGHVHYTQCLRQRCHVSNTVNILDWMVQLHIMFTKGFFSSDLCFGIFLLNKSEWTTNPQFYWYCAMTLHLIYWWLKVWRETRRKKINFNEHIQKYLFVVNGFFYSVTAL